MVFNLRSSDQTINFYTFLGDTPFTKIFKVRHNACFDSWGLAIDVICRSYTTKRSEILSAHNAKLNSRDASISCASN